jgi:hypothetical protein
MNDTLNTIRNRTIVPPSLNSLYNLTNSKLYREFIYLSIIPLGFFGFILNIFTFAVLNNNKSLFKLPVYFYVRVYTIKSAFICLIATTLFIGDTRILFKFTNSQWAMKYFAHFYIPITNSLFFYQTCLDCLLTFDRLTCIWDKFKFYNRSKPKKYCIILSVFTLLVTFPYWLAFKYKIIKTKQFVVHYMGLSDVIPKYIFITINLMLDALPLLFELPLNILTIILLRKYLNELAQFEIAPRHHPDGLLFKEENKFKKIEIKVTFIVVIMSLLSLM